jgi:hypothetical protein
MRRVIKLIIDGSPLEIDKSFKCKYLFYFRTLEIIKPALYSHKGLVQIQGQTESLIIEA